MLFVLYSPCSLYCTLCVVCRLFFTTEKTLRVCSLASWREKKVVGAENYGRRVCYLNTNNGVKF